MCPVSRAGPKEEVDKLWERSGRLCICEKINPYFLETQACPAGFLVIMLYTIRHFQCIKIESIPNQINPYSVNTLAAVCFSLQSLSTGLCTQQGNSTLWKYFT